MKHPLLSWVFRFFLVGCLLLVGQIDALYPQSTQSLDVLIQKRNLEIQRLKGVKQGTVEQIERVRQQEDRVSETLRMLSGNIKDSEAKMASIVKQITQLRQKIRTTEQTIANLQRQIEKDRREIDHQLRALFYIGQVKSLTLFIGLNSFENYFRNRRLLERSTRFDIELLDRYLSNLEKRQAERLSLEEQQARLAELQRDEEIQKELLEFERRQQHVYLQHLRADHTSRVKYLREIQVELEQLNDTLYSLETRKENREKTAAFDGFFRKRNQLLPPVEGKLVHRFGQTQSPFFTLFRQGVLVETQAGAAVQSIMPGKVVWSGPFRGYQNLVILDHGKGSLSVYGNLDEVFVIVDDVIESAYTLGTVAWDDVEQRALFYFETRYNKKAVDPLQWLKKPVWN